MYYYYLLGIINKIKPRHKDTVIFQDIKSSLCIELLTLDCEFGVYKHKALALIARAPSLLSI